MQVTAEAIAPVASSRESRYDKIDLYRLLFAMIICVYHFELVYYARTRYLNAGYIGVEFFFIVSGVFLMKSAVGVAKSPVAFAAARLRRLYPHYALSFAFFFGYTCLGNCPSIVNVGKRFVSSVLEVTLLQMAVPKYPILNQPAWFLSALLLSSVAIYTFASKFGRLFLRLAPVLACVVYLYFAWQCGNIHVWQETRVGGLRDGLLRASAGVLIGCLCFSGYAHCSHWRLYRPLSLTAGRFLGWTEVVANVVLMWLIFSYKDTLADFAMVFLLLLLVALCLINRQLPSVLSRTKLPTYAGKLSYAVYLNHWLVATVLRQVAPDLEYPTGITVFCVVTVVYSMGTTLLVEWCITRGRRVVEWKVRRTGAD